MFLHLRHRDNRVVASHDNRVLTGQGSNLSYKPIGLSAESSLGRPLAGYGQGAGASVEEVRMTTILGIDAAWTATGASGVALVASARHGWRCIAIAPSYDEFYSLSRGRPVTWIDGPANGSPPNVSHLLRAARALSRTDIDLVAVDMPVATVPIVGRRVADRAISTDFGGRGCSTHTPNISRPGALGARLMRDLASAGYSLATGAIKAGTAPRTIEVYLWIGFEY